MSPTASRCAPPWRTGLTPCSHRSAVSSGGLSIVNSFHFELDAGRKGASRFPDESPAARQILEALEALPMPALHAAFGLLTATTFSSLFATLSIPLAYILGALVGSALYANRVAPIWGATYLRRGGQLVVGTAVGGLLTAEVVAGLADLFPLMLAMAIASNAVGVALAFPVARLAGTDHLTALLSCLPAAMAEMALLARDLEADEQVVSIIHTLRVVLVVATLPILVGATISAGPAAAPTGAGDAAVLIVVGALGAGLALLISRLGFLDHNWGIAPMALGLFWVSSGGVIPRLPEWLLTMAQIGIGASLGVRFSIERLRQLPRAAMAGVVSALVLIAVMPIGLGALVAVVSRIDYRMMALATAPGGLGEMIASAKAIGLASATVAGFQFVRSALTNSWLSRSLIRR